MLHGRGEPTVPLPLRCRSKKHELKDTPKKKKTNEKEIPTMMEVVTILKDIQTKLNVLIELRRLQTRHTLASSGGHKTRRCQRSSVTHARGYVAIAFLGITSAAQYG